MIDSTYIKAHRTACSLAGDGKTGLLGRSRGGITTKIHLLCNAEDKPTDFELTGGEVSDIKIAPELEARQQMKKLPADKATTPRRFGRSFHDGGLKRVSR